MKMFFLFITLIVQISFCSPVSAEDVPDVYAELNAQVDRLKNVSVEEMQIEINLTHQVLVIHKGEPNGDNTTVAEFPCSTGTKAYELIPKSKKTVIYQTGPGEEGNRDSIQFGGTMKHCLRLKVNNKNGSEAYVAIHAGNGEYVPRIPTSHGCIRLPRRVAFALFNMIKAGSGKVKREVPVVFTGEKPVFKLQ